MGVAKLLGKLVIVNPIACGGTKLGDQ